MLHRVYLLSWWPFSGYSGSESGSKIPLSSKMLSFFARFILFNIATLILWFFIHSYYETIFCFFLVKASQIFGLIPFTNPDIINGEFSCRLGKATCHFNLLSVMLSIFITIPLLLSTSGIPLLNKIKMTLIGLVFLFFFQLFLSLVITHAEIYQLYPLFLKKGVRIDQLINYTPLKAEMFSWLNHFCKNILQFPVAVGIWISLVSYYKKSCREHWTRKLF